LLVELALNLFIAAETYPLETRFAPILSATLLVLRFLSHCRVMLPFANDGALADRYLYPIVLPENFQSGNPADDGLGVRLRDSRRSRTA
jgi:hypothetical protein